jgi:glycosyltransferase involved in cell wall biosynthesis
LIRQVLTRRVWRGRGRTHGKPDKKLLAPGRRGILVKPGEPAAYAKALAELAADSGEREAMGVFAEAHVKENYGGRRHAEILEGFMEEAIDIRKKR